MTSSYQIPDLREHLDQSRVTSILQKALRQTIFSSGLRVSPRQLNRICNELSREFFQFWIKKTYEEPIAYGSKLAREGLGVKSVLALTEALREISWQESNPVAELPYVTSSFCNSLLEGYITGREELLLDVQERTHRAYLSAMERSEVEGFKGESG